VNCAYRNYIQHFKEDPRIRKDWQKAEITQVDHNAHDTGSEAGGRGRPLFQKTIQKALLSCGFHSLLYQSYMNLIDV